MDSHAASKQAVRHQQHAESRRTLDTSPRSAAPAAASRSAMMMLPPPPPPLPPAVAAPPSLNNEPDHDDASVAKAPEDAGSQVASAFEHLALTPAPCDDASSSSRFRVDSNSSPIIRRNSSNSVSSNSSRSDAAAAMLGPALAAAAAAPSSPSSSRCDAPHFHDTSIDPLTPGFAKTTKRESLSLSASSNGEHSEKQLQPDHDAPPIAASASSSSSSSAAGPAAASCTCFSVQYTCAPCKSAAAIAAAAAAAAQESLPSRPPSSASSSSSSASSTSPLVSSCAAAPLPTPVVAGAPPKGHAENPEHDDAFFAVPTVSLAALEAQVRAMYHIEDDAEERALKINKEAVQAACLKQRQEEIEAARARKTVPITASTNATASSASVIATTVPAVATAAATTVRKLLKGRPVYTWEEIRTHKSADSCWLVVRGTVYDVTQMLSTHPAGIQSILRNAGTEASQHFDFHSSAATKLWKKYEIGVLEGYTHAACAIQ